MSDIRINVSRTKTSVINEVNVTSLGASYTHIKSLKNVIGPSTKKIIMYHSFLESLEGFEDTNGVDIVYLGFNRIKNFRKEDSTIKQINVLDLAGNPITSLVNCPPCKNLIVSSTKITNLEGCPEGVEVIRCGHSDKILSLKGCPSSVKLIECSCCNNLVINKEDLPQHLEELI
jgi:Leucine-rich repeat (LRR) protein